MIFISNFTRRYNLALCMWARCGLLLWHVIWHVIYGKLCISDGKALYEICYIVAVHLKNVVCYDKLFVLFGLWNLTIRSSVLCLHSLIEQNHYLIALRNRRWHRIIWFYSNLLFDYSSFWARRKPKRRWKWLRRENLLANANDRPRDQRQFQIVKIVCRHIERTASEHRFYLFWFHSDDDAQ